jgi:hypothetical protein
MPVEKNTQKVRLSPDESNATGTTSDLIEESLEKFAEQLRSLVGTVQAKTEGWLDSKALSTEIGRIRDSAADLLEKMNHTFSAQRKTAAKTTAPARRASRGPVDAPGKRHRTPPPQEPLNKRMGEPEGKRMGQKGGKSAARRGPRR